MLLDLTNVYRHAKDINVAKGRKVNLLHLKNLDYKPRDTDFGLAATRKFEFHISVGRIYDVSGRHVKVNIF